MQPNKLIEKMDAAVVAASDNGFRTHLGASVIGHNCPRAVWYGFRWTAKQSFDARMLRLFERGNKEEFVFEDLLRKAGMEIHTIDARTGTQFRICDFGGHFGGSTDGVGTGIPELPGVWVLLEMKTHNDKSFKKLYGYDAKAKGNKYVLSKGEGVEKSKPQHFAQMQTYMGYQGLTHALYCAVNKNDDMLYFEIVPFNAAVFNRYKLRAANAIQCEDPPERISKTPAWFECGFCEFKDVCHSGATPWRNCRTCKHSIIDTEDGVWRCGKKKNRELTKQQQEDACQQYTINPAFKR